MVAGGVSVPFGAAKHRALLLALLLRPNEAVSTDLLVDALWPTGPPASAGRLIHVYVSQLRKALPETRIATVAPGYELEVREGELDSARFEHGLEEGRSALVDGNAPLAAALLGRALALWRGPALADVAYESFARAEAMRLDELRLVAQEERLAAEVAAGRHEAALAELRALVAQHPLRERPRAQLMLALYRHGRQVDALEVYRAGRTALRDELGLEPGVELRDLERAILSHDPALASPAPSPIAELPTPPNPLIGRERELAELGRLVRQHDTRLLTLTGAGGSGKSRLALALARATAASFANGAVLVDLGSLRDHTLFLPTVMQGLGVAERPGEAPAETLAGWLRLRELLVVLDSFEHLLSAGPELVRLLAAAPRLRIVVTSRAVLHLSGEQVYPVQPLPEDDALELLVARARALEPHFGSGAEDEEALRAVCRRLDGLPLAIELAGARARMLSPASLRERLDGWLPVLGVGPRDLPARQQTLRATLEWSTQLLQPGERRDLAALSVFAGGCTLEAAEAVCGAELDRLGALVDQSLLQREFGAGPRFSLLETVREHARELLPENELETIGRAHATFFTELAERAETELGGAAQGEWLERLEREHENARVALAWLVRAGEPALELRLAAALGRFRYVRGHLTEGRAAIEDALARGREEPAVLRAKACRVASALAVLQGDYAGARRLAEQGLSLYRGCADLAGVARSLSNLGAILVAEGELERAADVLDEAVARVRGLGEPRLCALALNNRGDLALTVGDWQEAETDFGESLSLLRELGDTVNVARSLFNLGACALERGSDDDALDRLREGLALCVELGDHEDEAWCLVGLAALAERRGEPRRAAVLLGAADALLGAMGASFKPYEQRLHERVGAALALALEPEVLRSALADGRALDVGSLVAQLRGADTPA